MKLISWNVQSKEKVSDHVLALSSREPQVVALQEVTPNAAPRFEEWFKRVGLSHVAHTFQDNPAENGSLGVLVASCYDLVRLPGELPPLPRPERSNLSPTELASRQLELVKQWKERILPVTMSSIWSEIDLYNIYTVHYGKGYTGLKVDFLDAVYCALANNTDRPRILCGDFNTPQAEKLSSKDEEKVITWGRDEVNGEYFLSMERLRQRQDDVERKILLGLANYDLPDVYRSLHGYENSGTDEAISYIGWGKQKGKKFRYDHVFASKVLRPKSAEYLHEFRTERKLSDHSPLEVVFEF